MKMAGAAPVYLEMSVGIEMSVTLLASVVPAVLDPGPTASSLGEDDDIDDAEGRIGWEGAMAWEGTAVADAAPGTAATLNGAAGLCAAPRTDGPAASGGGKGDKDPAGVPATALGSGLALAATTADVSGTVKVIVSGELSPGLAQTVQSFSMVVMGMTGVCIAVAPGKMQSWWLVARDVVMVV
jgi:hypothetical protein